MGPGTMIAMFERLFGSGQLSPIGDHLRDQPELLALNAVSDIAIGLAYLVIPAAIWTFVRRRPDLPPSARRRRCSS